MCELAPWRRRRTAEFADHADPATAAQVCFRAGYLRAIDSPAAGGPLMEEALRLFEGAGPSPEHARAWLRYALDFLNMVEDRSPAEIQLRLKGGSRLPRRRVRQP